MTARTLRVAAAQLQATLGDPEATLRHAEPLVIEAAAAGAKLVVLPELFSAGYVPNLALWHSVEGANGPTPSWLSELARRLGIHVGGGYAAWAGDDVLNIFALAQPDGTLAGMAQKRDAESYLFRRRHGVHVIDCALGRIGVGICADCQSARLLGTIRRLGVDLMLMPHASPVAAVAKGKITEADVRRQHDDQVQLPVTWATSLGVPAVFVNQVGPMARMTGILGSLMDPAIFRMQGNSRIVSADGTIVAALDAGEGIAIGDVMLGPTPGTRVAPRSHGGWLTPGNPVLRRVIIPLDIALGVATYRLRRGRRHAAALAAASAPTRRVAPAATK